MLDLETLGRELRRRRRTLRLRSNELAHRIGVSQTYVWLIESAKERPNGEPSRPSEDVLDRWLAALRVTHEDAVDLRSLAGYVNADVQMERSYRMQAPQRTPAAPTPDWDQPVSYGPSPTDRPPTRPAIASQAYFSPPGESLNEPEPASEESLSTQLRHVLRRAEETGREEEAVSLTESFLRWLRFHLGDENK